MEVLEVIKHLFSVPYVHFVLGVNLEALEGMVRARYSPEVDAHRYLGKFIQVRLELPDEVDDGGRRKAMPAYLDHLVRRMEIPENISTPLREEVKIVSRANHVSLRDIARIVSSVSLASDAVVRNPEKPSFLPGLMKVMSTLIISSTVRHFSDTHIWSTLYELEGTENRRVKTKVGAADKEGLSDLYMEMVMAFQAVTTILINYIEGWVFTKEVVGQRKI